MTAAARISQADVERVVKGVKAGGYEHARIVLDFENRRIEVMLGEADSALPTLPANPWDSLLKNDPSKQ